MLLVHACAQCVQAGSLTCICVCPCCACLTCVQDAFKLVRTVLSNWPASVAAWSLLAKLGSKGAAIGVECIGGTTCTCPLALNCNCVSWSNECEAAALCQSLSRPDSTSKGGKQQLFGASDHSRRPLSSLLLLWRLLRCNVCRFMRLPFMGHDDIVTPEAQPAVCTCHDHAGGLACLHADQFKQHGYFFEAANWDKP